MTSQTGSNPSRTKARFYKPLWVPLAADSTLQSSLSPTRAIDHSAVLIEAAGKRMWRPMQIYLSDWWPVLQLRRVLTKLSHMPVELAPKDKS